MQLTRHQIGIRHLVGPELFARARPYASDAVVRILSDEGDRITAQVLGTATLPYATSVTLTLGPDGEVLKFRSRCSCPVGEQCKHAVAVLLLLDPAPEPEHPVQLVTARAPVDWRATVDSLVHPVVAEAELSPPVAIQFDYAAAAPQSVTLRPVLPGRSGWVRTGISWSNLTPLLYGRGRAHETQFRRLNELIALFAASADGYLGYYGARTVTLEDFGSHRLWDLLDDLRATGIPFVPTRKGDGPVVLHDGSALAALDLRRLDDSLRVEPRLDLDGRHLPATAQLIGTPAHGVFWTQPASNGPSLHLVRLDRTGSDARATARLAPITVPAVDVSEFIDGSLLALRDTVPVLSSDGSVELTDPGAPSLELTAAHNSGRLLLTWSWRYVAGDADLVVGLGEPARASRLRDPQAESGLAAAAAAICGRCPPLVTGAAATVAALRPSTELVGTDLITFAVDVLPKLETLAGVHVNHIGDALDLREASGIPSIEFAADDSAPARDWLDLDVTVRVDGHTIPFVELFRALSQGQDVLMLPDGLWFRLDRPEFQHLAQLIDESRRLYDAEPDQLRVGRYSAGLWDELEQLGTVAGQVATWRQSMRGLLTSVEAGDPAAPPVPTGLRATLRPYQETGFAWLVHRFDHGLGGVLADEMGLGKTLQCLALICHVHDRDPDAAPFLVVAPTSVVSNWADEIARFAPHLRVAAITDTSRKRGRVVADVAHDMHVVVTSYALFRLDADDYAGVPWSGLLLDEAQFVKNHRSQAFGHAVRLEVPFKLAITGTPMENNLAELWSMFAITAPGLFGDLKGFEQYYRTPIEAGADPALLQQLRRRIRPFMLRRTKAEVIDDLPAKQDQVLELDLDPAHRRAYQTLLARERRKVLGLLSDFDRNQFEILRSLTLLRQASLDVGLVDPTKDTVPSTKLDELMAMVTELAAEGHRVVVFSQFTRFLERARVRLSQAGLDHCYLDGRTRKRAAVIERFKSGDAPVFLISIKAGGFGLNLTEADYCIVLDPWWNPAVEAQAVDRVHRIGQTRKVTVYRLVARDTIEQKVMALQRAKAELFAGVVDDGDWSGARLSADDIRDLVT